MSQKQTSEQCNHTSKVLTWGYELKDGKVNEFPSLWGCTECDATSPKPFQSIDVFVDHSNCKIDPCFGCKAKGLQLNTGDAGRDIPDKQWNAKLAKYRQARADGIQPGGTGEHFVEAAYKASETLGTAYDANTMVPAHQVTTGVKEVMKEIGDI